MNSTELNRAYYEQVMPGPRDYWRFMAAPRYRVKVTTQLLREIQPASVVDLGCGGGQLLEEVADALPHASLCGVDLAERQIEENLKAKPSVRWCTADLNVRDSLDASLLGTFDAVIALEVIEHLENPSVLLENALRLARPSGGKLILSTQSGTVRETERRVGHLRHFTAAQMDALLVNSGWAPVRVWSSGWPFHDLSKWWANRDPERSMATFGNTEYGPRQKAVCLALRALFQFNSTTRGAQLFAVAQKA